MDKKALILAAGAIKGAFQVGAVREILNQGFEPDIIHGISVGSLNGVFLVNETGRLNNQFNWKDLGISLTDFWINNITGPGTIISKRSVFRLLKDFLFKSFSCMTSNAPISNLAKQVLNIDYLRASEVDFTFGAVDMMSGKIRYFNSLDYSLIDGIIASSAIPVIMPVKEIEGTPYYDGGLRDIAPLKSVIEKGASEIVIILCHSEELSSRNFNTGNVLHLLERIMDIVVNETVNNDIEKMKYINRIIPEGQTSIKEGKFAGKRKIRYKIIRPQTELTLKIDKFTTKDIKDMISLGELTASKAEWEY